MNVVHILSTDVSIKAFPPFLHGKAEFRFSHLSLAATPTLFEGPVWIFVDWVLPEISGLDMIRRLRNDPRTSSAHITMVLEQCDDDDKRRALRAGADDYLVGPAHRKQILDRVLSLMSERDVPLTHQVLERGPLLMDIDAWRTTWDGKSVQLTPHEFRLLRFFVENPNRALSRSEVIEALGRDSASFDGRNVDAWVRRLRAVFERSDINLPLRTVRSVGYVYDS
ncbi:response regulator transcription factor [Altererythrobacter sp. GH1-8]|uniref:response regulator transcription factor n=1 Tax=Altererythrobacter sp. GH1-8 TaxID=3349333 RepID=UPI00374CCAA7